MKEIKADEWFKQDYIPATPYDEEEHIYIDDDAFSLHDVVCMSLIEYRSSFVLANFFLPFSF